jgi:hypothetical protein
MQKNLACLVLFSVTIVTIAFYDSRKAMATEAEGFKSTSLAQGRFREIDVTSTFQGGPEAAGEGSRAITATDKGIVRRVCAEQHLGSWRKHWLAHASRSKLGNRHSRDPDGL